MLALVLLAESLVLDRPELRAARVESAPVIDGVLDDAVWQQAARTGEFTQKLPLPGANPSEPTTLLVAYDREALYVAFDCVQQRSAVLRRVSRRDQLGLGDAVFVDLGTHADARTAFQFSVNAAGVLADGVRFDDTQFTLEWDENWQARTALTERGWSAEFRIPLRILRFQASDEAWDFQARRFIAARQEWIEWRHIARESAGEVSQYGKLLGVIGSRASSRHELRPFFLGRLQRQSASAGAPARLDASASAGADLKYHVSQSLTLDATFNPDFAQIEADREVLNLGNTESYFPEKRPFFLEGSEIFATPLTLLYTRRIGRAAELPAALGGADFGERLTAPPEPARIYAASKLSGNLGKSWTLGVLQALTAPSQVGVAWNDGRRAERMVDPTSAYGVLRLRRDLPDGAHIGTLLTAVRRLETPALARSSERLCPSGESVGAAERCSNDAYVASLDVRWPSPGGHWVVVGQLVETWIHAGPARHLPDGTVLQPGAAGQGLFAQLAKRGGAVIGDLNFEYASPELDYSDLGYSARANLYGWSANVEYRVPRPSAAGLESQLRCEYLAAFNLDGVDVGSTYRAGVYGKLDNLSNYALYLHYFPRYFDDRETGDGLALERAARAGIDVSLGTDPGRLFALQLNTLSQWVETGAYFEGSAELALRPLPELTLELGPMLSHTLGEPRFAGQGADGEYVFGRLRATSVSALLRSSYAFSPELALEAYAQLFLASGHYTSPTSYALAGRARGRALRLAELEPAIPRLEQNPDFVQGSVELQLMLRWELGTGSTLYAVYRHAREHPGAPAGQPARLDPAGLGRAPALDSLALKLSLWWGN